MFLAALDKVELSRRSLHFLLRGPVVAVPGSFFFIVWYCALAMEATCFAAAPAVTLARWSAFGGFHAVSCRALAIRRVAHYGTTKWDCTFWFKKGALFVPKPTACGTQGDT